MSDDTDASPPAALDDADALRQRVLAGPLVAMTDFDGTLAEIVEDPDEATIREDVHAALSRLTAAPGTAVAVVSGRAIDDLRERVAIEDVAYAGNHGLEIEVGERRRVHPDAADARAALESALEEVGAVADAIDGARVEDKELSATVHYRQVADEEDAQRLRDAVSIAVQAREGLEVHEAKAARELRPAVDWDKGRAADWLVEELADGGGTPLYVGDDTTDEDAFRAVGDDGVTVRVGDGESAAAWRVPDPAGVAVLLDWIAAVRDEQGAGDSTGN